MTVCVDHAAEESASALGKAPMSVGLDTTARGDRRTTVERQNEAAVAMEANDLTAQQCLSAAGDAHGSAQGQGETFGLEHSALVRNQATDASRTDGRQIQALEHGARR
jgi:hypothetical protein